MSDFAASVNQINVPPPPPDSLKHPLLQQLHTEKQFFLYRLTPSDRPDKVFGKKPMYEKVNNLMTAGEAQYQLSQLGAVELLPFPIGHGDYFYDLGRHRNPETGALTAVAAEAISTYKSRLSNGHCLGYYLDPATNRFFYDLDGCRNPETGVLTPFAQAAFDMFTVLGAYIEISPSGTGLHIVGTYRGPRPTHRPKNEEFNLELYTADRGMAIGNPYKGTGSPDADCTEALNDLIASRFQPKTDSDRGQRAWTNLPDEGFNGPRDYQGLLNLFLRGRQGKTPTNQQLWEGDLEALTAWKPAPNRADVPFDPTAGDMLMAGEANFYGGNNFELTLQLMVSSPYAALRADKWKDGVLRRETISRAYKSEVYNPVHNSDPNNVGFVKASTQTQVPVKLPKIPPAPMGPAAFHGIVGDFARLVEPSTEGDINALVVAFLTAFGCKFGRQPHYYVEDSRHGLNLFSVIVGESSKARKGTVTGRVINLLKLTDPEFHEKRLHKGLSTGEGLIVCVRDGKEDSDPQPEGFPGKKPPQDQGVADKRLLALESEFASVLEHGKRDGNILSAIMRDAWDGSALRIMAKSNRDSCQKPHIGLIGNITLDELQRCLSEKDRSNGFGNRILWTYARRSKVLPRGKRVSEQDMQILADRIVGLTFRMPGELTWSDAAGALWDEQYARLTESNGDGLVDSLTARAEAQVLRIAMIYAVLDGSNLIQLEHLQAAIEVWRYCEDSAKFIFGGVTSNKLAEDILGLLLVKPEGMSQTELSAALGRNKTAAQLKDALEALGRIGKVRSEERKNTIGRSTTVWVTVNQ